MARKVFISVLGTGFYDACKYTKGNFASSETRFIQQATLEYLKVNDNWTSRNAEGEVTDRVLIMLTNGAKDANWDKSITKRMNHKLGREEAYTGLEQVLINMDLPCPVETLSIPDGTNEEDMWIIFNTVYETLLPNDELYFDLTHSYRYLPMLVLVLGNYAKFLKGVTIKHISYGNFEARNKDTNEAPLMDILPLAMLQDWTFAAADLIQNGNIQRFLELKDANAISPLMRARGEKNVERRMVEGFLDGYIQSLKCFLDDMKLCLAPNILSGTTINRIMDCHELVAEVLDQVIAPIPPIVDKIQKSLRRFETTDTMHPDSLTNGYEAAKWCYDHQLYQQAITILDESITTQFCKYLGTDEYSYEQRTATNALLRYGEYREADWRVKKKDMDESQIAIWERVKEIAKTGASFPQVKEFISLMRWDAVWIHNKRNAYNHASMTQDTDKMLTADDVVRLGKKIRRVIGIVK